MIPNCYDESDGEAIELVFPRDDRDPLLKGFPAKNNPCRNLVLNSMAPPSSGLPCFAGTGKQSSAAVAAAAVGDLRESTSDTPVDSNIRSMYQNRSRSSHLCTEDFSHLEVSISSPRTVGCDLRAPRIYCCRVNS